MHYPWFVITGAPSSGKTTMINLLQEHGYHTQAEVARQLIASGQVDESQEFERHILRRKIEDHLAAPRDRVVFFDRGIPDSMAYYRFHQYHYDALLRHSLQYAAYQAVFLLEPLPFEDDGLRSGYADHVQDLHRHIKEAYHDMGLPVINVPALDPINRLKIIQSEVDTHEAVTSGLLRIGLI